MISIYNEAQIFPAFGEIKAVCLSTDTKPMAGIITGERLLELNTGKVFVFSNESSQWYEIKSSDNSSEESSESGSSSEESSESDSSDNSSSEENSEANSLSEEGGNENS